MQPTFDMLCLTCPCHHRNGQLLLAGKIISIQATNCKDYIQFLGSALGPHPGIREILESPLSVFAMPLIPAYLLFSERVNTFKPANQILG